MYKASKDTSHSENPVPSDLLNDLHHNLHKQDGFSYIISMYIVFNSLQLRIIFSPSYIFISLQATWWSYWPPLNHHCILSLPFEADA